MPSASLPETVLPEIVLQGIGVSHGVAVGPAFLVAIENPKAPEKSISQNEVAGEIARFEKAVAKARLELEDIGKKSSSLPEAAAEDARLLLDAHLAMLAGSRLVRGVEKRISQAKVNAEFAVEQEIQSLGVQFRALADPYIAARGEDVAAVGYRLIRILMDLPYMALASVPPGGIVLAREISPADSTLLDPSHFSGLATIEGGAAGHTAVMARSMGLPAVLGLRGLLPEAIQNGMMAVVDGISGRLVLHPSPETLAKYREKHAVLAKERQELQQAAFLPHETKDGQRVTLCANLELPRDVGAILSSGAEGIGLFRTEFMFMNRATLPSEDEQFKVISAVVRKMGGNPVTFRTLDIGGDKLADPLGGHIGKAANPALGLRAIRLSLKEPELLKTQFRAILRAGHIGPVRILLPMVTTADEVVLARRILKECHAALLKEKIPAPEKIPPLGTMIEIPAAALAADSLAVVSDFFALGTNDLVQYTVAIDRGNDQVAFLYNPLNPAVLRLIQFAVEAGVRAAIPVSICGEMGADPKYTALLLGLGIREFSVGCASLPRIGQRIRALTLKDSAEHARQVMNQYDPAAITRLVDDFAR